LYGLASHFAYLSWIGIWDLERQEKARVKNFSPPCSKSPLVAAREMCWSQIRRELSKKIFSSLSHKCKTVTLKLCYLKNKVTPFSSASNFRSLCNSSRWRLKDSDICRFWTLGGRHGRKEPLLSNGFAIQLRNFLTVLVYLLWVLPPFLPTFYIHPQTFGHLRNGAGRQPTGEVSLLDLMLPGVIEPPEGFNNFLIGELYTVTIIGCKFVLLLPRLTLQCPHCCWENCHEFSESKGRKYERKSTVDPSHLYWPSLVRMVYAKLIPQADGK
jgi:hypothetical protein